MSVAQPPFQARIIFFRKVKEIKKLRGGDRLVAAQAILQIDAEIAEKEHSGWKGDRAPDYESRAAVSLS